MNEENFEDFNDFLNADSSSAQVPESAFKKLKNKLFPSPWKVFLKIFSLHIIIGFLSLTICNQFGLNPFKTEQALTDWFMSLAGHNICMILCGLFFMSTTYVLANFVLTLEEFETIKKYEWLETSLLSFFSISAFYFFGAELVSSLVVLWIIGSFIGGLLAIEGSFLIRRAMA